MSFWSVARIQREALALHCLGLAGYETYLPRLRTHRMVHGRKLELRPALFPGYAFVWIELQWHAARWAPGVISLVMDGVVPAQAACGTRAAARDASDRVSQQLGAC